MNKIRIIKTLVLLIVFFFLFAFSNELYMGELWNFDGAYFRSCALPHLLGMEEKISFFEMLRELSKEYDVEFFLVEMPSKENDFSYKTVIYGNGGGTDNISKVFPVQETRYSSFFSGDFSVEYKSITESYDFENTYFSYISFIGSDESIDGLYDAVNNEFSLPYPEILDSGEKDMMYIVWTCVVLIMLFFTLFEITVIKKEYSVRFFMGENLTFLIIRKMGLELLLDALCYLSMHMLVFSLVKGEFMAKEGLLFFVISSLICALSFLSLFRIEFRRTSSNVSIGTGGEVMIFLSKLLISAALFVVICMARQGIDVRLNGRTGNSIEKFKDYNFVSVRRMLNDTGDNEIDTVDGIYDTYRRIYGEGYADCLILQKVLEDDLHGVTYVLANEAAAVLSNLIKSDDISGDVLCLIPKDSDNSFAHRCVKEITDTKDSAIEYVGYDHKKVNVISHNSTYGYELVTDPVIIIFNDKNVNLEPDNIDISYLFDILYRFDDDNKIISLAEDVGSDFEISLTEYRRYLEIKEALHIRIIKAFLSLSVFVLILYVFTCSGIVALRYRSDLKELAVKKVLGYGVLRKNIGLLLYSVLNDFFVVAAGGFAGLLTRTFGIDDVIAGAVVLFVADMLINIIAILDNEKKAVGKALKNGFS